MEDVREVVLEIGDLKGKFDALGITSRRTVGTDEVTLITSQVARVKKAIQTLKKEGRKVYDCLAIEEMELLKDIKALKEIVSEESSEKYYKSSQVRNRKIRRHENSNPHESGFKMKTERIQNQDVSEVCDTVNKLSRKAVKEICTKSYPHTTGDFKVKTGKLESLKETGVCDTVLILGKEKEVVCTEMAIEMPESNPDIRLVHDFTNSGQGEGKFSQKSKEYDVKDSSLVLIPQFHHSWEAKDNSQFIRIHHKYSREERRLEEWQRVLCHKMEVEIQEHAAKYELYLKKKAAVRNQLGQWRSAKKKQKMEKEEAAMKDTQEKESRMKEVVKRKEERLQREREERFCMLDEWKKAKKSTIQEETKSLGVVKNAVNIRSHFYSAQQQKHTGFTAKERKVIARQLEEYRQWKQCQREADMAKIQAEVESKKQLYNIQARKEFRRRDKAYIKTRKEWKKREERQKEEQSKRLDKIKSLVKVEVESSKKRLMQPTVSYLAYKLTLPLKENTDFGVDKLPHLGIPAWRQDL